MAGIGFVLRKLQHEDDLLGTARAYIHASLAVAGPWLFTVITLGIISALQANGKNIADFRAIITYNFSFSMVAAAATGGVLTRYIADSIFVRDVTQVPAAMYGCMTAVMALAAPFAFWLYFIHAEMPVAMRLLSFVNFEIAGLIWVLTVFLTALKDYRTITRLFGFGMLIVLASSLVVPGEVSGFRLLAAFTAGLGFVAFALIAKILAEYPYRVKKSFFIKEQYSKYRELALSAIFYNAAVWADKWLMWLAPESAATPSGLVLYHNYDASMFLAYLSVVPALAFFVFSVETDFFEKYQRFYDDITGHATLARIRENHKKLIESILSNMRNVIVVQGVISFLLTLLAPQTLALFGMNYAQLSIFRFGLMGAFFHVQALFLTIMLSYFDCRKTVMRIYLFFLAANTLFTALGLKSGFLYYGYGYFLASVLTFLLSAFCLFSYVRKLPYHTFVRDEG